MSSTRSAVQQASNMTHPMNLKYKSCSSSKTKISNETRIATLYGLAALGARPFNSSSNFQLAKCDIQVESFEQRLSSGTLPICSKIVKEA